MSLSIYQKTCPACLAILSISAERCECGHRFQTEASASGSRDSEDAGAQQEELYRAYIAARLEQAAAALEEARTALAADPENFDKARHVMQVLHEVQQLRAEQASLEQQALGGPLSDAAGDIGSAQPTAAFRAAAHARAEAALQRLGQPATRECPDCRARLPASCARCFCGYLFATGERAPRPRPGIRPASD